jgi:C-terminal processing protease CtpA/Prc
MFVPFLLACHHADDSDTDAADVPPVTDSTAWCDRVAPGPADPRDPLIGVSAAHATVRLFGVDPDFTTADRALGAALAGESPDLDVYAAALTDGCALDASEASLPTASVELRGTVAWIHPGTGVITLPEGATVAVLDLRGLPGDVPADVIAAAVAPALATPVPTLAPKVRTWAGYVDQVFSATNVYTVDVDTQLPGELAATGAADLPLYVVNDARMAPGAALVAADLLADGRAWLIGHAVLGAVAESTWLPVGDRGLVSRVATLEFPDVAEPTVRTDDADAVLDGVDPSGWAAPRTARGDAARVPVGPRDPFTEAGTATQDLDLGQMRADLVTVHGVVRRFWRYFPVVGDTLDDRLLEVVPTVDGTDRRAMVRALGRLGEAMHDGHVFFGDRNGAAPAGYAAVIFDHLADGQPVVRGTSDAGVHLGDALVAVDGTPIADVYADLLAWHGAATDGYARDLASRELERLDGRVTWTLADPDGAERDVVVEPQSSDVAFALPFGPTRANGRLDDLGAADVAYLNLDSEVTTTTTQVNDALDAADGAAGLIVDMRGYPGVDHYAVARALIEGSYSSPRFLTNVWAGPDGGSVLEDAYPLSGHARYAGPVVLLVGPRTVSAAENFSTMLVGADAVTVIGRNSAGTNGNITGLVLPGGMYFTFTGMEVQYPDGSTFHGVGIVPDVEVVPTAADLRDGRDAEIEAAITWIHGG